MLQTKFLTSEVNDQLFSVNFGNQSKDCTYQDYMWKSSPVETLSYEYDFVMIWSSS